MKSKLVILLLISLFSSSLLASFLPSLLSPTKYENMSIEEQMRYNDAQELEPYSTTHYDNNIVTVEKLNWFSVVNSLFEKFTDARVVDVETKKEYKVRRVGGYNHADVEALTTKDTATFKSLYNGTWSWTRRAVWVQVGKIWIAASINGMPHSYSYISDNNEDGHTCIHFYMSRTHGSDNLDPAHQNAVNTAYERQNELVDYLLKR
ncbi:MAG: hypothetical protein ACI4T2_02490 [Christensenellales bacterium]